MKKRIVYFLLILLSITALAIPPQDRKTQKKNVPKEQPVALDDDENIPDSLLHPRWKIKRTIPVTVNDLDSSYLDLKTPDNIRQQVEYIDSLDMYLVGSKLGDSYLNAPLLMTPAEYRKWSERRSMHEFFRKKSFEFVENKGKEKFDFTDMHFSLGPAEKIFGPGGVRIKTQGTAELKMGVTLKNIDNPSLPERNRNTKTFDFDEKINLSVNGKVGDKVNMNFNYNTDATFDFDTKNLKLKYEGKEDEIIKLVELGSVTFPTNNSLVRGASTLFGVRTDMQFGKLKLQTVFSQKNSTSKSVSSKGGTQMTSFEMSAADYEENRHFFLSDYFRSIYDRAMASLPDINTGITIKRVEIWVTNKSGTSTNSRNIIALPELGENMQIRSGKWTLNPLPVPCNEANSAYSTLVGLDGAREIDKVGTVLDNYGLTGGLDYEKLAGARLLSPSEYTVNNALGFVSLKTGLQTDQVLAIAYEYTYMGSTYQVGEFASDLTDVGKALFVKSLRNTATGPSQYNWDLMMKNVYFLASTLEKTRFKLDIKLKNDTAGTYLNYIPEQAVMNTTLLKLLGCDRLDNNNKVRSNGFFDFVEGYTINNGRVFFPAAEPFGDYLREKLREEYAKAGQPFDVDEINQKYIYQELYDTTKTAAKQSEKASRYIYVGQYKGSAANVISLSAYNVPQGSVVVTAGGVQLQEGSDYTVDYSAGEVTILNQSLIDAGTNINVSLESNTESGIQRKTMLGLNWEYDFSKNFQMAGTIQHLQEQPLVSKVKMGTEPLNNTLWGVSMNWKQESQWLTDMLNKIPFLHVREPSHISFTGEFAHLIAGKSRQTQGNASYIDDFENNENGIDVSDPKSWIISSVPSTIADYDDKMGVRSGYNRALLAWYNIDPLFTRSSSSLTPSHIKSDLNQLSNHYVREVYVKELYPNRDQSTYSGSVSTLPILNMAFYPDERGPYNLTTQLNFNGTLTDPETKWGGMMRRLDTNDFEQANIEYLEFWMLDPFIYTRQEFGATEEFNGKLFINLGEISEDVLRDGKKFYESGMPVDDTPSFELTQWGKIPLQATQTYAFATTSGSRAKQDVGFNGLNDEEEREYGAYRQWLENVRGMVDDETYQRWLLDPANDNYHYSRGSDYDAERLSILDRYKRINMPQGNSPDSEMNQESYDTSYKTGPDVEDINQDFTLNEYERYYEYEVPIDMQALTDYNNNQITPNNSLIIDRREYIAPLRNGNRETVNWYKYRIPLRNGISKGGISNLSSVRFLRMYMTGFRHPIVLRMGSLDLVRGEWRIYNRQLDNVSGNGELEMSAVNIEENNDKVPVNYIMPPGISRITDPSQPQIVQDNEQAMRIVVKNLAHNESKAVYKKTGLDMRQYKRIQMFVHANRLLGDPNLDDDELAVFIRLGTDYRNNYYEYQIPLKVTPESSKYSNNSTADRKIVWPEENMLDIELSLLTNLKKNRNVARAAGTGSYNQVYSEYDPNRPNNKMSVLGNPSLGEVQVMVVGVRNIKGGSRSGEVWVNELRLLEYTNSGGWAAAGTLNLQLSDFATVNLSGKIVTEGFGGLEDGVAARAKDNTRSYNLTTNMEMGKFFPDKAKVSIPVYYSRSEEITKPKYNPLDTDILLSDALDAATGAERDSIESIAITKTKTTNFSISNARVGIKSKRPMPYDPANFSFSYSHYDRNTTGHTTVYEREANWRGALNYAYSPVYKTWEPFKKVKGKSKWLNFPKSFGINYLPQSIAFNTEMTRRYTELQERDLESAENQRMPLTYSSEFLWNRDFSLRWDFTKNLHMNFNSATRAQIEEPDVPVNKDLYPDEYQAWKDSVWQSIKHWGKPLDYRQNFTASYQLPLNKLPIFDWVNSDASYTASYNWIRGTEREDGTSLGNTITNNRNLNINGTFNMVNLYNHVPFLKKVNDLYNKRQSTPQKKQTTKRDTTKDKKNSKDKKDPQKDQKKDPKAAQAAKDDAKEKAALPVNKNTFQKEIVLKLDTTLTIAHNKKSKRIYVTARTKDGKPYNLKYKVLDENKILIKTRDTVALKLSVTPKAPLEEQWWYKPAQAASRFLMMTRNISVSYRNQYAMNIPGFTPNIGDIFGQRTGGVMAPGLGFAFGFVGEDYIDKCLDNGWLRTDGELTTPATTNATEDLQIRASLEPVRDLKIDLTATRTVNKAKSIQYMYEGRPTSQSGSFLQTTISLGTAFGGMGDANNGYYSATFEKFCNSLDAYRERVEAQYAGAAYEGSVNKYSADVMIPAFLDAYTMGGGGSLDLFPTLKRLLPNWTVRYTGLVKLPWFRDTFKSFNINHAYKSIFSVGSYNTYSSWLEYMGDLGFIKETSTGNLIPSSKYSISTVSINEAFSPLLGVDMTFNNGLTAKIEYRQTRVLTLSMTSVQINEALSKDFVIGLGYKIQDFNLFGSKNNRKIRNAQRGRNRNNQQNASATNTTRSKTGVNHDLNIRLDVSYRRQAAITRDIATMASSASSGNTALKISLMADYTLSRLMTLSAFYDRQTNTPLLSSSSYPTTTQDFGVSLKFSLTR